MMEYKVAYRLVKSGIEITEPVRYQSEQAASVEANAYALDPIVEYAWVVEVESLACKCHDSLLEKAACIKKSKEAKS
jgi:hypothetical protein